MHKSWPWLLLSIFIILLDQLSKYLITKFILLGQTIVLLPFLNLTLSFNSGAAFSFLDAQSGWQIYLFSATSLIVSLILFIWLLRLPRTQKLTACAVSLILGGAIGNLIDRLYLHYVRDFIDFHIKSWHFATFNVADSAVCVGAALLLISLIFRKD